MEVYARGLLREQKERVASTPSYRRRKEPGLGGRKDSLELEMILLCLKQGSGVYQLGAWKECASGTKHGQRPGVRAS